MNEQSITVRWDKNSDGSTDISVSGDIDGQTHFREAFLSLDMLPPLYDISETNTSGESAGNSATASLLRSLIEIIRKSDKTSEMIISEQKRNSKFPFTDLITIRKFAQIAGIKIDERIFRNRREFQMYFRELMKEDKGKEDWR